LVERVWRLVKSELAVTSVTRLAKISDELSAFRRARQVAKSSRPESVRASSKDDGRWLSSRCESVKVVRSFECKYKTNRLRVQSCLSHSSGRSRSVNLPRRRKFFARGGRRRRGAAISTVRMPWPRGCSSAGRAPALQAGGQRFEPAHLHQHIDNRIGLSRSSVVQVIAKLDPLSKS
jgi:hypothetical protein